MQYREGTIGRVFLVRFEHGDDLVKQIKELAVKENIALATITLLGAIKKGDVVTGPKELKVPAESVWASFSDGREVLAAGMIVAEGQEAKLHLHGAFGRGKETLTGCLRKNSEVFITIDGVVTELKGIKAVKRKDEVTGHEVLKFDPVEP